MHSRSTKEHLKELSSNLKEACTVNRDKEFGDYRTKIRIRYITFLFIFLFQVALIQMSQEVLIGMVRQIL